MTKNLIICVVLGAILFTVLLFTCGCTKTYEQNPTCFRYLELSEKYDGEMVYLRTDTLWPNGRYDNVVCGADVDKLLNYKPSLSGCAGGWQLIKYEVMK